ncbi:MAG TPA: cupredoxin domain-containing protein [Acidimicrobiia bacterium]|nr:cupredoxin domain-containing protein [Acidimicrobiia bacterium]
MRTLTKLMIGLLAVFGLAATAVGLTVHAPKVQAQTAGKTVDIKDFQYNPADLAVKVGEPIKITNEDTVPHTVTARDGSFDVSVPANGSATVTVPKAGNFPYYCTYHPDQHNPASFNAS